MFRLRFLYWTPFIMPRGALHISRFDAVIVSRMNSVFVNRSRFTTIVRIVTRHTRTMFLTSVRHSALIIGFR